MLFTLLVIFSVQKHSIFMSNSISIQKNHGTNSKNTGFSVGFLCFFPIFSQHFQGKHCPLPPFVTANATQTCAGFATAALQARHRGAGGTENNQVDWLVTIVLDLNTTYPTVLNTWLYQQKYHWLITIVLSWLIYMIGCKLGSTTVPKCTTVNIYYRFQYNLIYYRNCCKLW